MIRNAELLQARRKYVFEVINKAPRMDKAVMKLSKRLFLSESTIEKDYYVLVNKETPSK